MRTRELTALERSVAKQFATGDLNQVLGCTNLTLAPTGSHMNTVFSPLVTIRKFLHSKVPLFGDEY
jgi:hypothetical protein